MNRNPIARVVKAIRQQVIPDKRAKEQDRSFDEQLEDEGGDWPFHDDAWQGFGDD